MEMAKLYICLKINNMEIKVIDEICGHAIIKSSLLNTCKLILKQTS